MGLIDFFRQLAAARQGNTQNPYNSGVPSVVNNAMNPTTKANMSVTDPSDPTSITQGTNGPVAQVSQDATAEIPPASPKGPSIPSKILSVIGGLSGLAGKVGEAMQDNGIGEGLNEQQFEARQARALQRRSLDQQQQAQQAAQMRDYVNTMSEVQARTAGTAHAQAEEKLQQDQLQAQKEATLASVLGKTAQGGNANINGRDVDITGEAQRLAMEAPYNAKPFTTASGGLVSVIPGPNGSTATPVMNAPAKTPAPSDTPANTSGTPSPDGIPPVVRNGAGLPPSPAPTPTDTLNAPGTPFQGLAKTARFSPIVDKQSGLTYALMDEFTKQPYSVDGKTPLSPADLAQAQLGAHNKHRAEHLEDEEYVTKRQANMLNAHTDQQMKMLNMRDQEMSSPAKDIMMNTEPSMKEVDNMLQYLEPMKNDNTPFKFAKNSLLYRLGVSSELSPDGSNMRDRIAQMKLMDIAGAARVLKGSSRAYPIFQQAMQHLPDVGKDSPQLMYGKLQQLKSALGEIEDAAQKYGQKGYGRPGFNGNGSSNQNQVPPPPPGTTVVER